MQAGDFLIELLGETIDGRLIGGAIVPQIELGQHLVGKRVGHYEARMPFGAAQVHQPPLGQQVNAAVARQVVAVHLRLDIHPHDAPGGIQALHLDLIVEVANIADDSLVPHLENMLQPDHIAVAGAGDVDVRLAQRVLDGLNLEPLHRGLQGVDRVNLGHDYARPEPAQAVGAAFADIAVAADAGGFAGDHHAQGTLEAVGQRFAAAVQVVELGLGDGVIDVDGGHQQFAGGEHLVEAVDAGGGFLAHPFPVPDRPGEPAGAFLRAAPKQVLDDLLFVAVARGVGPIAAVLHLVAPVQQQRGIAAVVHDQFRPPAAGMRQRRQGEVPVVLQRFAFEREDGDPRLGDRRRRLVLGAEDIATGPAHRRAQLDQRLDQHGRLDGHMQRAGHAHTLQGLARAILLAHRHQPRHLLFRHGDFLAAPIGEAGVFDPALADRALFAPVPGQSCHNACG